MHIVPWSPAVNWQRHAPVPGLRNLPLSRFLGWGNFQKKKKEQKTWTKEQRILARNDIKIKVSTTIR